MLSHFILAWRMKKRSNIKKNSEQKTYTHIQTATQNQVEQTPHDLCEFIFDSVCVVWELSNKLRLIICIFYSRLKWVGLTGWRSAWAKRILRSAISQLYSWFKITVVISLSHPFTHSHLVIFFFFLQTNTIPRLTIFVSKINRKGNMSKSFRAEN